MPNADILEFLFATVATIVATVTGLIGAFATFRLQNISTEIGFLKGFILAKKVANEKTLNDYIKGDDYHLLEKIYDRNLQGVRILKEVIDKHQLHYRLNEFTFDLQNTEHNQIQYDTIKKMTIRSFGLSLCFVFANLILLLLTTEILELPKFYFWGILYYSIVAVLFGQFVRQVKELIQ
ncbi:MAG: hypothetical protein ABI851_16400 [Saprospiraceae bacterium]